MTKQEISTIDGNSKSEENNSKGSGTVILISSDRQLKIRRGGNAYRILVVTDYSDSNLHKLVRR